MTTDLPSRDYLRELLTARWFSPPVALWRAVELRVAASEQYSRPLLDLGCGDGQIAEVLVGSSGADVGLDPWLDQVHRAERSGVYRWVQQADGNGLPFRNGYFATVFSNSVLEHIQDVAPVLREVGRVLRRPDPSSGRQGGRLVFTVPSDAFPHMLHYYQDRLAAGDRAGADEYVAGVNETLAHYHYHTPQEWAALLSDAGMELEKAVYYIPEKVERLWDRMNAFFGTGKRSWWGVLASPRLAWLQYQRLLRLLVAGWLGRAWRSHYLMDVPPGDKGGGLLVVGRKT